MRSRRGVGNEGKGREVGNFLGRPDFRGGFAVAAEAIDVFVMLAIVSLDGERIGYVSASCTWCCGPRAIRVFGVFWQGYVTRL